MRWNSPIPIFICIIMGLSLGSCRKNDMNPTHQGLSLRNDSIYTLPESCTPDSSPVVTIEKGSYIPLYGKEQTRIEVSAFEIDVYPVTQAAFLAFVKRNPKWQKSYVKRIFANQNYLKSWENDTTLGRNISPNAPVTNLSWYAAKAYCECQGKRLPTVDEWEYVAMADEKEKDARANKEYIQYILGWYEKPKTFLSPVGSTFKNYWGVYDLHGLVWEWTADFNSVLITGESRNDVTPDNNMFCGSGSLNTSQLMNYAAFMRYAFRGSLKADFSIQNLGFRCIKDIK